MAKKITDQTPIQHFYENWGGTYQSGPNAGKEWGKPRSEVERVIKDKMRGIDDNINNIVKSSVNDVAVSYPAIAAATPSVKINASTGNIESTNSTNDRIYFNAVKFAKGDVIQITGSGSTARSLIFGFTTTDPASLQTLVGLQLTDVVATAVTTSFNLELICPYDNAYLLYYRYSSYTVNFTRYSLSAVKSLPSTISANKSDIETKLATEVREMVTKTTIESSFSYSDKQSGAYIDSTGEIKTYQYQTRMVFYSNKTFEKGDIIHLTTSGSSAMVVVVGFSTDNPVTIMTEQQTLVGMMLTNVSSFASTASHDRWIAVPFDNAYMLYYRESSLLTFNWTVNSLSSIKSLPSIISANKTDIETKLATEVREMVTKSTVESTFSYSDSQSYAYIDSSGEITTYQYQTRKVYYSSKVFKKGDIIHLTTSGSNAMGVVVGFSTDNPVTRMTEQQTLVGMRLTNVSSFASTAAHDRLIVVPFDNAYMLYYRESSTLTFNWTVNSLSSIKSLPTNISNNKLEVEMAMAVRREGNYDKQTSGSINSDGTKANSSAWGLRQYYVDGEFSSIKVRTSVDSGRALAFYSDHTMSSESKISVVSDMYANGWRTVSIPAGTKMIVVGYPASSGAPTNNLVVILGQSESYLGSIDRNITSLKDFNNRVTRMYWAASGDGNTQKVKKLYTMPGHRYRIRRDIYQWDVTGITSDSTEIIGLYSYNNGVATKVVNRTKGSSTILPNPFDFTAGGDDTVEYYEIHFKATSGTVVRFDIQDITEIVSLIGKGTSDVVQMCGGMEAVQLRMRNISKAGGLRLLYFSDIHTNPGDALGQIKNFKDRAGYIHDILSGGDNVYDQPEDAYAFANEDYKSMLTVVGNHDVFKNGVKLTTLEVFGIHYGAHAAQWSGVTFPDNYNTLGLCYWYKDYATPKVRLIGLDCINWSSDENTWLANVLADAVTNNLHVVICMHYKPYNFVGVRTCTFNSLHNMSAQSANEAINNTVLAAIGNGLKFVCYLFGHEHKPYFGYVNDHQDLWAFAAAKPSPPIGTDYCDRFNEGNGSLYRSYYEFYIINIDTTRGVIAISTVGNNRDMYERPMNNLVFDYINHQILSNS